MPSSINTNLLALNTANSLNAHYSRLATSIERLSSGLRVNSAADDAAGLAIRELMRSDVATLNQGIRNANDAISMLQVADGALAIIDEKLIRMKELAEQAATGTYDSTQRLIIDSEFQAMGSEIDRIARATDFNGIKLLDGSLSGAHNGSGLDSTGAMKIHFGTANDSAEDYYYVEIGNCATKGLGLHDPVMGGSTAAVIPGAQWLLADAVIDWDANKIVVNVDQRIAGPDNHGTITAKPDDRHGASPQAINGMPGFDYYALPAGLENVTATSWNPSGRNTHKPHINLFTKDGTQLTGVNPDENWPLSKQTIDYPTGAIWWNQQKSNASVEVVQNLINGGVLNPGASYNGNNVIYQTGQSVSSGGMNVTMISGMSEDAGTQETIHIDKITSELVFMIGGHDTPGQPNYCNVYSLRIEADMTPELKESLKGGAVVIEGKTALIDITTQEKAQRALARIDSAITRKDKVRAHLGAIQNRLENTVTNLSIQAENLQAAESRISDADIAIEMTQFVRNQILAQSAVAMLGQANSFPHMLMNLLR